MRIDIVSISLLILLIHRSVSVLETGFLATKLVYLSVNLSCRNNKWYFPNNFNISICRKDCRKSQCLSS